MLTAAPFSRRACPGACRPTQVSGAVNGEGGYIEVMFTGHVRNLSPSWTQRQMELAASDADGPLGADEPLLERIRAGDAAAFESIVRLHAPAVSRLVQRLLGWPGDVEDVVQEVFVVALEKLSHPRSPGGFQGRSSLRTWLMGVAIGRCRSWRTRMWRWRRRREATEQSAEAAHERLQRDEACAAVRRAIRGLPQKLREVVVLHYLQEMTIEEVAAVLSLSRGAVDVRLHRARTKLKVTLEGTQMP